MTLIIFSFVIYILAGSILVKGFESARGYKMERPLYLNYLRACEPHQPPPPRPSDAESRMCDKNRVQPSEEPNSWRREQRARSRSPLTRSQRDSSEPWSSRRDRRNLRPPVEDRRRDRERRSRWDNNDAIPPMPPQPYPTHGYPQMPFLQAQNPAIYQAPNYSQMNGNNYVGGSPLDNLYEPPYAGHRERLDSRRIQHHSGGEPFRISRYSLRRDEQRPAPSTPSCDTGERSPQLSAYTWRRKPQ